MNGRDEPVRVKRGWGDLATRAAVGAGLIVLGGAALWFGGIAWWVLACVAALLMLGEWGPLVGAAASETRTAQFAASVPLAIAAPVAAGPAYFALGLIAAAAIFVLIVTMRMGLARGVLYVTAPALALMWLRDHPVDGMGWTALAVGVVVAADICAYFAGRAIGGPKLMPQISPNKTWAGLGGAVVGATVFAAVVVQSFNLPGQLWLGAPLLAVIAQMGDLFESHLKREAGVKDSGTILPGHGGVLDRLDGLVPVAPAVAMLALILG